jgi:DNA topoisomerase-1
MLDKAGQAEQPLGVCPETGKPVFVKIGRFGPYVQRGTADDEEKPQNASLLRGMDAEHIDLQTALKLLSLPRTLGAHPQTGEPVLAHNGKYGPYVKCGEETRSLPADGSPLDIGLDQALELLAQPKARRGAAARREPVQTFDVSPVTSQPIRLLQGRYGPYVTDGVTNASLPRTITPEEVTFEYALNLLSERAAAGPSQRTLRRAARTKAAAKTPKGPKKPAKPRKSPAKKPRAKTVPKRPAAEADFEV